MFRSAALRSSGTAFADRMSAMSERLREFFASLDRNALIDAAVGWSGRMLVALLILLVGWWLARRLAGALQRVLVRGGADPLLGNFLRNLVFVLLLAVVVVGALDRAGVPTASLLAALGAAGLAIGLALQGSLSNLAAGVLLMVFRPFRVGDYVQAGGIGGTVRSVNLIHTVLTSPDNCQIVVPNAKILGDAITNYSVLPTRRLDLVIGIGYGDDIGKAIGAVHAVLAADARVLTEPKPVVAVLELADSSVNLAIRPWVASGDYWPLRFDLLREIKQRFDATGISIPFPQREIVVHHTSAEAKAPPRDPA